MTDTLMTAEELAWELRVKPGTIKVWARQGIIPAMRLTPKVLRFDLGQVVAALRERASDREEA